MGLANWVVLYQLLNLEKESYKNRIFTFSCLFQKFSAVYDFFFKKTLHCVDWSTVIRYR